MVGFLILLLILAVAAAIAIPAVLIYSRQQARERKNYERGLKMVPLLIHLPPISEDTDLNGRDVRDLMDENISKAQVVYNIIASTYEKGFRRKIYGQQHFSFEVLSAKGFVYFYTTVPIGLVEVVRQAVVSAYPSARLEEAEEHNIFNPLSKMSGTAGGELVLKESFAYPIATFQDTKRDAMQALLNSLSTLTKEEGAAIQILLRPADPAWRKAAHDVASGKRKGEKGQSGAEKAFGVLKEVGTAFVKAPEDSKDSGGSDKADLSELDQAVINAIDDKTRYPAYEVLIRVVVSSNVAQRSQAILNNIVASFSLFDAPGKNGFKYEPAKDMNELVTGYVMKFFPQVQNRLILNSVELATIFHFPDQRSIPTSQLERQDSKQTDGPRNMPEDGLLLGYNVFRGVKKPIRLALGDRQRHMYVVGQTGTGKSTFLENLALQDMLSGNGFAFVDPHGDTAEKLLSMVPRERTEDVIYFCPADMDYPMGLNLFEYHNPDQKDFLIQEVLNMLKKLYDPNNQGIMGPRYEDMFRNAALAVMADPAGGTLIEIPQLFRDPQFLKEKLTHVKDQTVLDFWQKQFPASQRSNEAGEVTAWFVSKFGAFLSNEMMRNIIGQSKSSFNLRQIMDDKKILLVNLSKGRTGDLNSKLLGMIFVMQFQAAAMSRANIPERDRVDFSLYVDEFQNFSTDSFATIMSEARKYRLNLIVANQFTTQLSEEIRDAVFGNMGTIVAFRIGQNDVESLSRYFQPIFDGDDLLRVPNYNSIVRTLVGGVPTQPFSMAALPPLGEPNAKLSAALKQLSSAKHGRPKASVEKEIFDRIATRPAPAAAGRPFAGAAPAAPGAAWPAGAPGRGAYPPNPPYGQPAPAAPSSPASPASFLDDWLAKRGPAAANAPAAFTPSQPPTMSSPPAYGTAAGGTVTAPPASQYAPAAPTAVTAAPVVPPSVNLPPKPQPMVIDHSNDPAPPAPPVPAPSYTPPVSSELVTSHDSPTPETSDQTDDYVVKNVTEVNSAQLEQPLVDEASEDSPAVKKRRRNRRRKPAAATADQMPDTASPPQSGGTVDDAATLQQSSTSPLPAHGRGRLEPLKPEDDRTAQGLGLTELSSADNSDSAKKTGDNVDTELTVPDDKPQLEAAADLPPQPSKPPAAASSDMHLEHGDTIFIDQDGNLKVVPNDPQ